MCVCVHTDDPSAVDRIFWGDSAPENQIRASRPVSEEQSCLWNILAGSAERHDVDYPSLSAGELSSDLFIIRHAKASQFDAILEALKGGARLPERAACLAFEGDDFHGQKARAWRALKGNLHLTVLLRSGLTASQAGIGYSLLPSLATARAIRRCCGNLPGLGFKWVNDILIQNRKAAGVITETLIEGDQLEWVALGIGVNVKRAPDLPKSRFAPESGCLDDPAFGFHSPSLSQITLEILKSLGDLHRILMGEGCRSLLNEYKQNLLCLGRNVLILDDSASNPETAPVIASGRLLDINQDLSLKLSGVDAPIMRGRLIMDDFEIE